MVFLKNDRSVRVFSIFLVLTTIIWFLIELSKIYSSTAEVKLVYTNLPKTKILQEKPVNRVGVVLRASGFKLMGYQVFSKKVSLDLTDALHTKGNKNFLLLNRHLLEIENQLSSGTELLRFNTDTVFFELGATISKKIPVKLQLDASYKLGYNLMSDLKIQPDSILIIGPEKYIDTLQKINTKKLILTDVFQNINALVALQINEQIATISYAETKVKVSGVVEKITEGKLSIPVQIINVPAALTITTFPKNIEIVYQVGLSNFSKITENSFNVVFDYNEYLKDASVVYLKPIVKNKSKWIRSMVIKPSKIEFLIQKK